jgi:hypothetical protein
MSSERIGEEVRHKRGLVYKNFFMIGNEWKINLSILEQASLYAYSVCQLIFYSSDLFAF